MHEDPIVAEIHKIRRDILAEFGGDMDAYYEDLMRIQEEERKRGRLIVDRSAGRSRHSDAA